jgi:hypothetical protein
MIPAAELELKLREIWHWTIDMVPHSAEHSTYGVDAVGRCIELVQRWPDTDWETSRA